MAWDETNQNPTLNHDMWIHKPSFLILRPLLLTGISCHAPFLHLPLTAACLLPSSSPSCSILRMRNGLWLTAVRWRWTCLSLSLLAASSTQTRGRPPSRRSLPPQPSTDMCFKPETLVSLVNCPSLFR